MGAIGGILKGRLDRTAAMAQDLEDKGAGFKRSDPNLSQMHDSTFDSLPDNLQQEINRWQGALGRSTEIYVLPHNEFVDPSIGGGIDGQGASFQKIAGEPRRIVIDAQSADDPQGFIDRLQHQGGLAVDDTLQTQSPKIRNQLIGALKDAYDTNSPEFQAFTRNFLAGLTQYGNNFVSTLARTESNK